MNEYKLYNLEKQDKKKTSSYDDALKDKNILKLADEFDEDVSPSDGQDQQGGNQQQKNAQSIAQVEQTTEEEIQQSRTAVQNSVGDKQIRVPLQNNQDNLFLANIYVGTPSKLVRVILDTGSEHLAVASDLCTNCPTKPYSLAESSSKTILSNETQSVIYGSAKFEGKETQDKTCLTDNNNCMNFKFLSLQKEEGLDQDSDGILGLSPEMSTDRSDQHMVWSMMKQNLISRASFSLSLSDKNSFAVFGGIDENQIEGGANGLKVFRNNPDIFSKIKAWALSGRALYYGKPQIGDQGSYPAVIDTGSTLIAVPSPLFKPLSDQWKKDVESLDCKTDPSFCQVTEQRCEEIEHQLKPVGFLISGPNGEKGDTVFEINPSEYLFQAPGKCQFAIAENKLDKFNNKNFIFGQLFLRHFYTLYNFENEQISLGINKDSIGLVKMQSPSQYQGQISYANQKVEDDPKIKDVNQLIQTQQKQTLVQTNEQQTNIDDSSRSQKATISDKDIEDIEEMS